MGQRFRFSRIWEVSEFERRHLVPTARTGVVPMMDVNLLRLDPHKFTNIGPNRGFVQTRPVSQCSPLFPKARTTGENWLTGRVCTNSRLYGPSERAASSWAYAWAFTFPERFGMSDIFRKIENGIGCFRDDGQRRFFRRVGVRLVPEFVSGVGHSVDRARTPGMHIGQLW